jgi:pimeloyl-ACP methyl ester carboxylesterase
MDKSKKAALVIAGGWHVPEHYAKITTRFENNSVRVNCPRLPTNNNACPPDRFVEDDVAFLRNIIASEVAAVTKLTVVAHSYGGYLMTAICAEFALNRSPAISVDTNSDKIQGGVVNIVYMAGFIPSRMRPWQTSSPGPCLRGAFHTRTGP